MKLSKPVILDALSPGRLSLLRPSSSVQLMSFEAMEMEDLSAPGLDVGESSFKKCGLFKANLKNLRSTDTMLEDCDMSAADLSYGTFSRCEFAKDRLVGINLSNCKFTDVVFSGCKLDMANFRFTKLKRVQFIDCTFLESDFMGSELNEVEFKNCVIDRVIFDQCKPKKLDFRTSEIVQLSGWSSLKSTTIDYAQLVAVAPQIAMELGLLVEE